MRLVVYQSPSVFSPDFFATCFSVHYLYIIYEKDRWPRFCSRQNITKQIHIRILFIVQRKPNKTTLQTWLQWWKHSGDEPSAPQWSNLLLFLFLPFSSLFLHLLKNFNSPIIFKTYYYVILFYFLFLFFIFIFFYHILHVFCLLI